MGARKRHSKPQFVIPEEVEKQDTSGWTYRTEEKPPAPAAAPMVTETIEAKPEPKSKSTSSDSLFKDPMKSGMRAFSYGMMAIGETLVFSFQVVTLPMTVVANFIRR